MHVVLHCFLCALDVVGFAVRHLGVFADAFLGQLDFKLLESDFFCKEVKLLVVAHVVLLLCVFCDGVLCVLDFHLLCSHTLAQFFRLVFEFLDTGFQAFNLVVHVLDLQRKFAAEVLDAVDLR